MTRAVVYVIPISALLPVRIGEKRICNLPADAELRAADYGANGLGVRVHSQSFRDVPHGTQLPKVVAHLEKRS